MCGGKVDLVQLLGEIHEVVGVLNKVLNVDASLDGIVEAALARRHLTAHVPFDFISHFVLHVFLDATEHERLQNQMQARHLSQGKIK